MASLRFIFNELCITKCISNYEGVFCGGVFLGGIFRCGIHHREIWQEGIFRGGVLRGGIFAGEFSSGEFSQYRSPLNMLHILRTYFPKNMWRAPSVISEIDFEKWEKIRLDQDENTTTTYVFAVEQVFIMKIWILVQNASGRLLLKYNENLPLYLEWVFIN